ncbi:extensin-like [Lactuca sativa]|uniref:extensin-like n=1 Tax=Lactuca sativa TaxID=4236 RepID=UPI0022AE5E9E|nr:extensin-like [Lactuca sativa]
MADYLLSSIATVHTAKIIVTDPTNYSFIGSIPEAMLGRISASSNVLQQYRKRPSSGPKELTPAVVRSIEEADKPTKRGKKPDTQKEGPVYKPTKVKTPKKRKSDKAATSQAQPKKQKKPARRIILQSSSDSDLEYVPPKHKNAPPSESESESSDDEASGRGDTPPRSPTPEIPVRSNPPSPPPVTIQVSIPPIFPIPTTQPSNTIPIPPPIFTNTTTTTTTIGAHFTAPNPPVTTEPPVTT